MPAQRQTCMANLIPEYFSIHMQCLNYKQASLCCLPTEEIDREIHTKSISAVQATQVEQHGDTQVWLAKPEYREKYSLAKQIPDHLIADPSSAALTAQPNGIALCLQILCVPTIKLLETQWQSNGLLETHSVARLLPDLSQKCMHC